MIKLFKNNNVLILSYRSERYSDASWIDYQLSTKGKVTLRRTFTFRKDDLASYSESQAQSKDVRTFILGVSRGEYYAINKEILDIKYDLLISRDITIEGRYFVANRDISIFKKIDRLMDEQIVVGGDKAGAIPEEEFCELQKKFPTTTELNHYAEARISRILKDYYETMSDAQKRLDAYLNRKIKVTPESKLNVINEYEYMKFEYIRDELLEMLRHSDEFLEKQWQKLIVKLVLMIFPKYIKVFEHLHIKDYYSKPKKVTDRIIDLTLVDSNGTIDLIEIKKPFPSCVLSKRKYRDNFTPNAVLSGTIMQVEKYIFYLNKWGHCGEIEIKDKMKNYLPEGFEIKITNPKAIVIIGRDNDFDDVQKFDFEIIKRKYSNIIDIMTYDDILRRIGNIMSMLTQNSAMPEAL